MRHILTTRERIRGLRGAIASLRTPEQLRQPLVRELRKLEAKTPRLDGRARRQARVGFLDRFRA